MAKPKYRLNVKRWFRCPQCKGTWIQHRIKGNSYVCRKCGAEFTADFAKRKVHRLREPKAEK